MSRIGKITVPLLLALPLAMGGCHPKKGTANPEDYFPLIQVALAGGETGAMIGRNEAIKAGNFGGCVAAASLITGFDGALQVLSGKLQDKIVIPAVEIDVSECLALRDEPEPEPGDENASLDNSVVVAAVIASPAPAEEADKPAEGDSTAPAPAPAADEPPADGDSTAPAAEEPAAEEPPAEEPAADEPVAELKGNPGAAMLVETIAGITLVAVLHYATKLQAANCKKGTAALGAIHYVNGMIKPVADEIAEPDGKVSVPSVTIDLSDCAEG